MEIGKGKDKCELSKNKWVFCKEIERCLDKAKNSDRSSLKEWKES